MIVRLLFVPVLVMPPEMTLVLAAADEFEEVMVKPAVPPMIRGALIVSPPLFATKLICEALPELFKVNVAPPLLVRV